MARGRQEATAYGVKFIDATIVSADGSATTLSPDTGDSVPDENSQSPDSAVFVLQTSTGVHILAKRIIIATGLTDVLPDIPGLAEEWGETVLRCP